MKKSKIKFFLDSRGIKQIWLVKKLKDLGYKMDAPHMARICSGRPPRNLAMVSDMCEILNAKLTDLF